MLNFKNAILFFGFCAVFSLVFSQSVEEQFRQFSKSKSPSSTNHQQQNRTNVRLRHARHTNAFILPNVPPQGPIGEEVIFTKENMNFLPVANKKSGKSTFYAICVNNTSLLLNSSYELNVRNEHPRSSKFQCDHGKLVFLTNVNKNVTKNLFTTTTTPVDKTKNYVPVDATENIGSTMDSKERNLNSDTTTTVDDENNDDKEGRTTPNYNLFQEEAKMNTKTRVNVETTTKKIFLKEIDVKYGNVNDKNVDNGKGVLNSDSMQVTTSKTTTTNSPLKESVRGCPNSARTAKGINFIIINFILSCVLFKEFLFV